MGAPQHGPGSSSHLRSRRAVKWELLAALLANLGCWILLVKLGRSLINMIPSL